MLVLSWVYGNSGLGVHAGAWGSMRSELDVERAVNPTSRSSRGDLELG